MVAAEVLLFKNIHENFYYLVFRVADYESDVRFSKFKMVDPIWRMPKMNIQEYWWIYLPRGFFGLW